MDTISMSDARKWAKTADAGEYLCEYEDVYETDEERAKDDGSMCGFGADEIAEINAILARRDLTITADDRGLVAVSDDQD